MPYSDPEKKKENDRQRSRTPKNRRRVKEWKDAHRPDLRKYNLMRCYGITIEQFEERVRQQGGVCAICGGPPSGTGKRNTHLHVDHDHATGEIRGLLCNNCNIGIGGLKDSPDLLEKAAAYLRSKRS